VWLYKHPEGVGVSTEACPALGCGIDGAAGGCGRLWKTLFRSSLRSSVSGFPQTPTTPWKTPRPVFLSPLENRPRKLPQPMDHPGPVSHNPTAPTMTIKKYRKRGLILYRDSL